MTNLALTALQSRNVTPSATGVHFAPETSYDEWEQVGRVLWTMKQWVNWAIGDWVNFGERTYGEAYAQALDATGWEYQRIADCAWVSRAVPFSSRNESLSWTHHRCVARFANDPDLQKKELAEAYHYGFSTREFYADLKERYPPSSNGASAEQTPRRCPTCGQLWAGV